MFVGQLSKWLGLNSDRSVVAVDQLDTFLGLSISFTSVKCPVRQRFVGQSPPHQNYGDKKFYKIGPADRALKLTDEFSGAAVDVERVVAFLLDQSNKTFQKIKVEFTRAI